MSVNIVNMAVQGAKNRYYAVVYNGISNIYYGSWDDINLKYIAGKNVIHKSFSDIQEANVWVMSIARPVNDSPSPNPHSSFPPVNSPSHSSFSLNPHSSFPPVNSSNSYSSFPHPFPPVNSPSQSSFPPFHPIINSPSPYINNLPQRPEFQPVEKLVAYTDGSFTTRMVNNRKNIYGGWAYVIVKSSIINGHTVEEMVRGNSGKVVADISDPTNNRAELSAILMLLRDPDIHNITKVYSDSKYSIDAITSWYFNWRRNGWKTSTGGAVKNRDLIENIIQIKEKLNIEFIHVYSHKGNTYNEVVDKMAKEAAFG